MPNLSSHLGTLPSGQPLDNHGLAVWEDGQRLDSDFAQSAMTEGARGPFFQGKHPTDGYETTRRSQKGPQKPGRC